MNAENKNRAYKRKWNCDEWNGSEGNLGLGLEERRCDEEEEERVREMRREWIEQISPVLLFL